MYILFFSLNWFSVTSLIVPLSLRCLSFSHHMDRVHFLCVYLFVCFVLDQNLNWVLSLFSIFWKKNFFWLAATWHSGFFVPHQGWDLCHLQWKCSLNRWAREAPGLLLRKENWHDHFEISWRCNEQIKVSKLDLGPKAGCFFPLNNYKTLSKLPVVRKEE